MHSPTHDSRCRALFPDTGIILENGMEGPCLFHSNRSGSFLFLPDLALLQEMEKQLHTTSKMLREKQREGYNSVHKAARAITGRS